MPFPGRHDQREIHFSRSRLSVLGLGDPSHGDPLLLSHRRDDSINRKVIGEQKIGDLLDRETASDQPRDNDFRVVVVRKNIDHSFCSLPATEGFRISDSKNLSEWSTRCNVLSNLLATFNAKTFDVGERSRVVSPVAPALTNRFQVIRHVRPVALRQTRGESSQV